MYSIAFFFFKQKTAYDMRISDWSSDVYSSDLHRDLPDQAGRQSAQALRGAEGRPAGNPAARTGQRGPQSGAKLQRQGRHRRAPHRQRLDGRVERQSALPAAERVETVGVDDLPRRGGPGQDPPERQHHHNEEGSRTEEHTSKLQSIMRISYAVF